MTIKGSYLLIVEEPHEEDIAVGKLGIIHFKKGYYIYVGSAFGSDGIIARLDRHLKKNKKRHWHIDYLMERAHPIGEMHFTGDKRRECELAQRIEEEAQDGVPGFGSSDCKCLSHMFYFKANPIQSKAVNKAVSR